jgi:hypothetical protein
MRGEMRENTGGRKDSLDVLQIFTIVDCKRDVMRTGRKGVERE